MLYWIVYWIGTKDRRSLENSITYEISRTIQIINLKIWSDCS